MQLVHCWEYQAIWALFAFDSTRMEGVPEDSMVVFATTTMGTLTARHAFAAAVAGLFLASNQLEIRRRENAFVSADLQFRQITKYDYFFLVGKLMRNFLLLTAKHHCIEQLLQHLLPLEAQRHSFLAALSLATAQDGLAVKTVKVFLVAESTWNNSLSKLPELFQVILHRCACQCYLAWARLLTALAQTCERLIAGAWVPESSSA